MLLRSASRALRKTSVTGSSATNALKKYPQRSLATQEARQTRPTSEFDARRLRIRGGKAYPQDARDAHPDRGKTSPDGREKKLLTPYELSRRVKVACDKGDFTGAVAILKEAPRDAQNAKVWGTLIHEMMEAGRYKESYRLFTDMKRRGFSPSTRTFSTLFGGYTKIENWEQYSVQLDNVHSLYDQLLRHHEEVKLRDPDSTELLEIPYTQLVMIFGQAQRFQRMYDVFNAMPSEGRLAPSIHTYTALLNAIGNRQASSFVSPVSVLQGGGAEEQASEPSYHELMFKNSTDAKLIWRQLLKASTNNPTLKIDSHALRAFLKILGRGRPSDQNFAFNVVHEYLGLAKPGQQAIPPKVDLHPLTLESLLIACNNARRFDLTLHYVQQIIDSDSKSGPGQHPLGMRRLLTTRHMDIIFEAYAARAAIGPSDEGEDALEMLEWMHRMQAIPPSPGKEGGIGPQIRPTVNTYDLVALTCCRSHDWKRTCRVFELMTGYDGAQFRGDMREPPQQEQRSKGRSFIPSRNFMTSLIKAASRSHQAGNMQQALNIFEHYGWDTFLSIHLSEDNSSPKVKRDALYFGPKLAEALAQALPAMLKLPNYNKETQSRWTALLERAKPMVQDNSTQRDNPKRAKKK